MGLKTGRKATAKRFAYEMRVWRQPVPRKEIIRAANIRMGVLCLIEHGKAWQVPVDDILKLMSTLEQLCAIERERQKLIHKLFRILTLSRRRGKKSTIRSRPYSIRR